MQKLLLLVVILVAVIAVLGVAMVVLKAKLSGAAGAAKAEVYYLRKSLFSPAERSFLGVLEANLPSGVRVFGKVRLEDIFGVVSGLERGERQAARNRINRKHVDFLLVRSGDLAPVAGIELDDSSHDAEERQERDSFVDSVFASAGLPLLHVTAQRSYSQTEVKNQLASLLST